MLLSGRPVGSPQKRQHWQQRFVCNCGSWIQTVTVYVLTLVFLVANARHFIIADDVWGVGVRAFRVVAFACTHQGQMPTRHNSVSHRAAYDMAVKELSHRMR
jgi:hypothetical protein